MDSDHLEATPPDDLRRVRQARHQPERPSRVPHNAAGASAQLIKRRLARAEHLIRQLRPTTALALLQAPGSPPPDWPRHWHPRWCALVGWALLQHQEPQMARDVLQEGIELLAALEDPALTATAGPPEPGAWLRYLLGVSYCQSGQPLRALAYHRQGLAAIDEGRLRDPELTMLLFQGLGNAYLALGFDARAIACLTLARKRGQDVCNPSAEGMTELSLGLAYTQQENWQEAKRALTRSLQRFEEFDAPLLVAQARVCLGQVLLELRHEVEAEALLLLALRGAERLGDPRTRGEALGALAQVSLSRGEADRAIRLIERGLAALRETRDRSVAGQLTLTLARIYGAQHHQEAAEEVLKTAIDLCHAIPHRGLIARAHESYAQFLANQGRFQEAYEQLAVASQQVIPEVEAAP
jgi:tetratricopeptide (TPR) repeat protein